VAKEDLEAMREKKLAELKQAQAVEQQKKFLLKQVVDDAAYERLMNVRLANPELYNNVVNLLLVYARSGKLASRITEAQILQVLKELSGGKRETTITINRK